MKYVLRRLNITGPLDEHSTPIEVIGQCMTSHGLEPEWDRLKDAMDVRYRRKCISKLMELPSMIITMDSPTPSKREMGRAVRYINRQTVFTDVRSVVEALEFLLEWEREEDMWGKIDGESGGGYGPIVEGATRNIDCTMIYKICKKRGLQTHPEHTLEDMRNLLLLEKTPREKLRDLFVDRIHVMSSSELINCFERLIPRGFDFGWKSYFDLYPVRREVDGCLDPLNIKFPTTNHEAVIMAARNFKVNIIQSRTPLMEYGLLLKGGLVERSFPVDSVLQDLLNNDPYALRTDQRFFPELPEYVYQKEDLRKMAMEEGWTDEPSHYNFLREVYEKKTFFAYGKGPMKGIIPENETLKIELTPYTEEDPLNLVFWGSRVKPQNLICFTWSELSMTFEHYKEFRNPVGKGGVLFDNFSIRKLLILSRKPCINKLIADRRKRLATIIEKIVLSNHDRMERMREIRESILSNESTREEMKSLFEHLYQITTAMRTDPEGDTNMEAIQNEVGLRLIDLESKLSEVAMKTKETFLNLPIVIYHPNEARFSMSEEGFEGYTVGGRLRIVYEGEGTKAMSSCLRLSSNWFLSSVCFYQAEFGFPVLFDITRLVHIG